MQDWSHQRTREKLFCSCHWGPLRQREPLFTQINQSRPISAHQPLPTAYLSARSMRQSEEKLLFARARTHTHLNWIAPYGLCSQCESERSQAQHFAVESIKKVWKFENNAYMYPIRLVCTQSCANGSSPTFVSFPGNCRKIDTSPTARSDCRIEPLKCLCLH